MVKCLECGKEFKQITNRHLKFAHGLTTDEYRKKHVDAELFDKDILDFFSKRSIDANKSRKGCPRSDEVKQKIKNTKATQTIVPWNKGIPLSEEQKLKQSVIMKKIHKEKILNGTHPLVGNINKFILLVDTN